MFYLVRKSLSRQPGLYLGSFVALVVGAMFMTALGNTALTAAFNAQSNSQLNLVAVLMLGIFEICIFVTASVVSNTTAFSVALRQPELALLRLVGTTPQQTRRLILGEVMGLALISSIVGEVFGIILRQFFAHLLIEHSIAPTSFHVQLRWWTFPIVSIILIILSVVGVLGASIKAGRTKPVTLLQEAVSKQRAMGFMRWIVAILALTGTAILIASIPRLSQNSNGPTGLLAMLAVLIDLAVLLPLFVRPLVRCLLRPLQSFADASVLIAYRDTGTSLRRITSSVSPIMLAIGLTLCLPIALNSALQSGNTGKVVVTLYLVVAVSYALIGSANALAMSVYSQRHVIVLLKKLGGSSRQIVTAYALETIAIIITALILSGIAAAATFLASSWANKSAHFEMPWAPVSYAVILIVASALAASIIPAVLLLKKYRIVTE